MISRTGYRHPQTRPKGEITIPYAILRFEKHNGSAMRPLEAHHERQKEQYASNPDIDIARIKDNYHLIAPKDSYKQEIDSRIEAAGCRTRKDSIRFVDTLITASPEFFQNKTPKQIRAFFVCAAKFMQQEIGRGNIFSAIVHMDEKTPHIHLCFTPITADKRLCTKEILGNKKKMSEWQDKFHAHVVEHFPDLQRGRAATETGRTHIPPQLFKQSMYLGQQMEAIRKALDGINMVNAGKKRDEALSMLQKWFPEMEKFSSKLKQYNKVFDDLKSENAQLSNQANAAKKENWDNRMEFAMLQSELQKYKKFYDKLPPEVREQIPKMNKELEHSR